MRAPGFYWIKNTAKNIWFVAQWTGEWWELIRHDHRFFDPFFDEDYFEIGERIPEPS